MLWKNDRIKAEGKSKEAGMLRDLIDRFEMISSEEDIRALEMHLLLSGPYDTSPAIVSTFPGVGGEDATDWANMLLEMYERYAAREGWKVKRIDDNTIELKGDHAFGFLRNEMGVHRLVRISPYDAKQLRHTSFALVEVLPVLPDIEVENIRIPEKDLKVEFSRSSGPGGQNVNKVETAVRIVHIPTGISAASQVERSQAQNREKALSLLKARLVKLMEERQVKELHELKTTVKPKWGNQIRSYVLHPYKMVKDHRTDVETTHVEAVLDGDINAFIEAELRLPGEGK